MNRRKILLALVLLFCEAPAWAEWIKSGESAVAVYYIDPETILKIGQLHRFWAMQDMKEAVTGGVMSIRALQEYDCAEAKIRYLTVSAYSGPMAGGQMLLTDVLEDEWTYLPRGASSSTLQKVVCAR